MFDPQFKKLADQFFPDWVTWLGTKTGMPPFDSIVTLNSDIPKKTIAADRAYQINGPTPFVIHFEWETG